MKVHLFLLSAFAASSAHASSISINFLNETSYTDALHVDATDSSLVLPSGLTSSSHWNNLVVRGNSSAGAWNTSNGANVVGSSPGLINGTGASAASLSTTIAAGEGYAQNTGAGANGNGTQGLMGAVAFLGGDSASGETLTISGLGSEFTSSGYNVYLYFDSNTSRTSGYSIGSEQFWTQDAAAVGTYSGTPTWMKATGTTSGTATVNANYAVFGGVDGLTGSSFTISGLGANRAAISGIQIVAIPEPSAALLGGLGFLALLRRR